MPSPRPWQLSSQIMDPGHSWRDKWTALSGPLSISKPLAKTPFFGSFARALESCSMFVPHTAYEALGQLGHDKPASG